MTRIGLIRVLTSSDPRLLNIHGRAVRESFGVDVLSRAVQDQPEGVHNRLTHNAAAPKVLAIAAELAPLVDGIMISCSSDPGLDDVRSLVDLPVVGAGSAGAAAALALGSRVGVLALGAAPPRAVSQILGIQQYSVRSPDGVRHTQDLLTPSGVYETYRAAERLVDDGADVILQACTGLTSMGVTRELRRRYGLPVVDAVLAAGSALTLQLAALGTQRSSEQLAGATR
ncbi:MULTISPECIES: aspartate/glutamate racemase family protein [unclassified Arthrobacter]|uniref:aspartate/glutamate racemase family protein n=1 Tax=unclassified Arthrobacter TaxID=235627 RepID=UPI001CE2A621|nr:MULTISPECIES: aspartate/glutamate racemase family protein [unclassified Arthrobacter]